MPDLMPQPWCISKAIAGQSVELGQIAQGLAQGQKIVPAKAGRRKLRSEKTLSGGMEPALFHRILTGFR